MTDIRIQGRQVAALDLSQSGYQPADHVAVFRGPDDWTVVVTRRSEGYDEDGQMVSADALVWDVRLGDVAALGEYFDRHWYAEGWRALLDAGHSEDNDLYAAWVPERMDRDLDRSSIYNRDLALASSFLYGKPLPAPGRSLPDWKAHALSAMAVHLDETGWVVRGPVELRGDVATSDGDRMLGAIGAWRYGWAAAVVVRVDDCGEIFARLAEDADVAGPALRPLSDDEELEFSDELVRRRYAATDAAEGRG